MRNIDELRLLEGFHHALEEPHRFEAAMLDLAKGLNADYVHLARPDSTTGVTADLQTFGLDHSAARMFATPRAQQLLRPFESILPKNRPVPLGDLIHEDDFARGEFYNEVVRPAGGFHALAYQRAKSDDAVQFIFCRRRRSGEFSRTESDQLHRLMPHLTAIFKVMQRLRHREGQVRRLSFLLDNADQGTLIVERSGRLSFANAAAHRLLGAPDFSLRTARGAVGLRAAPLASVPKIVAEASCDPHRRTRRVFAPSPLNPDRSLSIEVIPIANQDWLPRRALPSDIAIYLKEIGGAASVDRSAIRFKFKLTEREADLAALLADGMNVNSIADSLGLTTNTVRFYLKQIFGKVDVHSQGELVSRLLSLR